MLDRIQAVRSRGGMIRELTLPIRDIINGPRMSYLLRKDSASWNRLCSALDVIEDTDEAIHAFISLPPTREQRGDLMGLRYLAFYGALQALYAQQDALTGLHKSLSIPFSLKDHHAVWAARMLRNGSIGHPTEQTHSQTQSSSNFLARITMDDPSRVLFLKAYADGSTDSEQINLLTVIAEQAAEVGSILAAVRCELEQRVADHRAKFMNDKMQDVFPHTLGYAFEKLFESFRAPERSIAGPWCVDAVQDVLNDVRALLQRQDMDIDTFDFLDMIYEELAYPVTQLRAYFNREPSAIRDPKMGEIVAFYTRAKVDELKQFAADFDSSDHEATDSNDV